MPREQSYSAELSQSLDVAIAKAQEQKFEAASGTAPVSEQVSSTVIVTLSAAFRFTARRYFLPTIVALLPFLTFGGRALMRALGQGTLVSVPAGLALLGLALFLPWQAWQAIRRAQGRITRRFFWQHATSYEHGNLPTVAQTVAPLIVGLFDVPALLIMALADTLSGVALRALMAAPVLVLAVLVLIRTATLGLSTVGNVAQADKGRLHPLPLASLDERIVRLTQIRAWLEDDALRTMVDEVIGRQVHAAARRQVVYSCVVGGISLIAGWLLSAITPGTALTNLLHR